MWDVFLITGLPIVGEIYNEFFLDNSIMDKKALPFFEALFRRWEGYSREISILTYTDWVKAFIENNSSYPTLLH